MGNAKRWRDDPDFVAWLLRVEYAAEVDDEIKLWTLDVTAIFMWEAFKGGREAGR